MTLGGSLTLLKERLGSYLFLTFSCDLNQLVLKFSTFFHRESQDDFVFYHVIGHEPKMWWRSCLNYNLPLNFDNFRSFLKKLLLNLHPRFEFKISFGMHEAA